MKCEKDMKNKAAKLTMIKDMLYEGKLIFSDRCMEGIQEEKGILWEMINYRKDENGKIPKENDHAIDALRYKLNAMGWDPKFLDKPEGEEEDDMRRGTSLTTGAERDYYGTSQQPRLTGPNIKETYEY
jgi:hypothetical protein